MTSPKIFCAIDTPDVTRAASLARDVGPIVGGIKLGLEFFNNNGPQGIEHVAAAAPGVPLFLDLKFHDIPNTVAGAARAVTRLGPAYINVHAAGGADMMRAARDAVMDEAAKQNIPAPKILAVTVLTSLDDSAMDQTGQMGPAAAQVLRLAQLTDRAGLDGVVCSAHEIAHLRAATRAGFVLMVPGIRPKGADSNDQKRVMDPRTALTAGATHLVIGRPITGAPDPADAARTIMAGL